VNALAPSTPAATGSAAPSAIDPLVPPPDGTVEPATPSKNVRLACYRLRFGPGDVLPAWAFPDKTQLQNLLDNDLVKWTDDPVSVEIAVAELAPPPVARDPISLSVQREQELSGVLAQLQGQHAQLSARASELEAERIKLGADNERLRAAATALQAQLTGTNNALAQKTLEVDRLLRDQAELVDLRGRHDALAADHKAATELNAELQDAASAGQARVDELTAQLAATNATLARTAARQDAKTRPADAPTAD
jgi:hypothetical protein